MPNVGWALVLVCTLWLPSAEAGTLYKCKDSKGFVAYQQAPCPPSSKNEGARSYQPVAASPSNSWSAQAGGRVPEAAEFESSSAGVTRSASGQISSYSCNDGRKQWVQAAPCPATRRTYETAPMTGFTTQGQFVTGTVTRPVDAPVEQEGLSKPQTCNRLQGNTEVSGRKTSDDAYERNKLRDASGC